MRKLEIAKAGGGVRLMGIPTVRDRVLQAKSSIRTESLRFGFSKHSYGFRPGRSQRQALEAAQKTVKEGKEYVVDRPRAIL